MALLRNANSGVLFDSISSGFFNIYSFVLTTLHFCDCVLCASQLNYDMYSKSICMHVRDWYFHKLILQTFSSCMTIQYVSVYVCFCVQRCCLYLQIEKLQTVQFVEEIMRESSQLAAVHVQALQLLQTPEGSTFQVPQWGVIAQIQLFQHPEVTEGPGLNPCDVVAI